MRAGARHCASLTSLGTLAGVAVAGVVLAGCPYQPVLNEPCDYDSVVGNCFEDDRHFVFDDARVDAIDLASLPGSPSACRDPVRATVTRVVDGDTIDVAIDGGATERVRFTGVDTPETYVAFGFPHCYGADAKLFTESLLGRRVALSFDRGCLDSGGDTARTLAYIWLGPRENDMWQRQLLRRGYAHELTIRPNDVFEGTFLGDEAVAMAEERGMWLECRTPATAP